MHLRYPAEFFSLSMSGTVSRLMTDVFRISGKIGTGSRISEKLGYMAEYSVVDPDPVGSGTFSWIGN